ncbi:TniQ family protein [Cytobacillus firmus]
MEHHLSVRSKPKSGELLLSYLLRLANTNDVPLLTLLNTFRNPDRNYYIQKVNLDLLCVSPNHLINVKQLVKAVGLTEEEIEKTSFHYMLSHFSNEKDILCLRILSGVIRNILYFCPKCLLESNHYKLLWKVQDVTICLNHECYLSDKCPSCKETIYYKDLLQVGKCPYCINNLVITNNKLPGNLEMKNQRWLQAQWLFLMNDNEKIINLQELSLRILYVLNAKKTDVLSRELIRGILNLPNGTEKLLQHARGTLIQSKTIHISFLIKILKELNCNFEQLFSMDVPKSFHRIIYQGKKNIPPKTTEIKQEVRLNKEKEGRIVKVLKQCLNDDEEISVKNICNKLGVSRGTIRNWGCNKVIAQYKDIQKEIKIQRKKEWINQKLEEIFSMKPEHLNTEFIYNTLGVRRQVLWKTAPEITAFIADELKKIQR